MKTNIFLLLLMLLFNFSVYAVDLEPKAKQKIEVGIDDKVPIYEALPIVKNESRFVPNDQTYFAKNDNLKSIQTNALKANLTSKKINLFADFEQNLINYFSEGNVFNGFGVVRIRYIKPGIPFIT